MRKPIYVNLFVTTFLAMPAYAGGYVTPIVETPINLPTQVQRPAFNWTGPYVGGYIGDSKINMKATGEIRHDAITVDHDAVTEDIPAETVDHPEVTEERVVDEIHHPAETETVPAVIKEHPEVTETVQTGTEEVQTGTETVLVREDVFRDENGEKQRDENHPTGWRHVPVYEEVAVIETRPIYEERVVSEAWTEVVSPEHEVVVKEAWTEEVTETVVVKKAWTEVVKPARTVVVKEAWTEVVREAWAEQLTDSFSKEGNSYGIFAGFRHQWQNNLVGGIEAHYGRNGADEFYFADVAGPVTFGKETYGVELQAGYAIKRALPYVAVGYANILDHDALTLSAGLDYAVTERLMIGAKYTHYDIGNINGIDSIRQFEADGSMVSLRAAIRF